MKISLVGCRDNSVNIFPALIKSLSKKISGVEVSIRFVPFFEDVPAVCMEEASSSDFVVAFVLLGDEEEVKFLKKKLVDVELLTKTRILKWVEEDSLSGKNSDESVDEKDELVDDISKTIVSILFKETDFVPQETD